MVAVTGFVAEVCVLCEVLNRGEERYIIYLTHCVHCEVRVKAEETVEHRVCNNYNIAKPDDSALMYGINAWVGVRIMAEAVKEVME
jgi:aspartyl/asparaginyl beta-hydroxylase (cupin superfamily)